jgi:uncharacterized membrane protein YcaP (DUF421 family)
MSTIARELGVTWTEAGLTVLVAGVLYGLIILLSRLFGPRSFATATSYDLAFVFALGSLIGRVILVRTSLAAGAIGLVVMFVLHAATGRLHHRVAPVHRVIQNRPVLVAVDGRLLPEQLRRARTSATEVHQGIRLRGYGSLEEVRAVVMEANGSLSVLPRDRPVEARVYADVVRSEHLLRETA